MDAAAAQKDGLTDHHAMGGAKKGSEGEGEGGGRWEVEAGTNCRAKKVMKIAARGGAAAGGRVQIQKRLYQTKHLTKDSRPRVVSARRETILEDGEKGRRKRRKRLQGDGGEMDTQIEAIFKYSVASTSYATRAKGDIRRTDE